MTVQAFINLVYRDLVVIVRDRIAAMLKTLSSSINVVPCCMRFMAAQSVRAASRARNRPTNGCPAPISGAAM